jgi:hypothetical protein
MKNLLGKRRVLSLIAFVTGGKNRLASLFTGERSTLQRANNQTLIIFVSICFFEDRSC